MKYYSYLCNVKQLNIKIMINLTSKIKEVLVDLVVNDKLPTDMTLLDESLFENVINEEVSKFTSWMIYNTTDVNTMGACRRYENKILNVKELMEIYRQLEIKEMFKI